MASQSLFSRIFSGAPLLVGRVLNICPAASISKESQETLRKLGIPKKPPKPLSAYMRFLQEQRAEIAKSNPAFKLVQVTKLAAEKWNATDDNVKQRYKDAYRADHKVYETNVLKYNESLTPEMRVALEKIRDEEKDERIVRKIKKINKQTDKPKAPLTPYNLFLKEYCEKHGVSLRNVPKGAYERISAAERERYTQIAHERREFYNVEIKRWEDRVAEQGMGHILSKNVKERKRRQSLKRAKPEAPAE